MDARPAEHPAQDRGPCAGLDAQRLGQGAGRPDDLVVEERGVQALAADLRGLFQDPVVGGSPGEGGAGAGLPGRCTEAGLIAASWRRTDTSASASPVSQRAAGPGRDQARAASEASAGVARSGA